MNRSLSAIGASLLVLSACGWVRSESAPYRPPVEPVDQGADTGPFLYSRDCGWCHGDRGEGTRFGPDLRTGTNGPALTDFVLRTGRMPLSSADEPMRHRPSIYTEEEIEALVDHVSGFAGGGPDIPDPDPLTGDLGRGAELYLENCAACHSTTGIGGAMTQGQLPGPVERRTGTVAPGLAVSTDVEIAEAVRTGPGSMPVFPREILSDREMDAIVRYVLYLQEPEDPGGARIGHIGPVAEGAVGWIAGLGVLLLFALWIGSRRSRA